MTASDALPALGRRALDLLQRLGHSAFFFLDLLRNAPAAWPSSATSTPGQPTSSWSPTSGMLSAVKTLRPLRTATMTLGRQQITAAPRIRAPAQQILNDLAHGGH